MSPAEIAKWQAIIDSDPFVSQVRDKFAPISVAAGACLPKFESDDYNKKIDSKLHYKCTGTWGWCANSPGPNPGVSVRLSKIEGKSSKHFPDGMAPVAADFEVVVAVPPGEYAPMQHLSSLLRISADEEYYKILHGMKRAVELKTSEQIQKI